MNEHWRAGGRKHHPEESTRAAVREFKIGGITPEAKNTAVKTMKEPLNRDQGMAVPAMAATGPTVAGMVGKSLAILAVLLMTGSVAWADDFLSLCKTVSTKASEAEADRMCSCMVEKVGAGDLAAAIGVLTVRAAVAKSGPHDPVTMPPDWAKGVAAINQAVAQCAQGEGSH